MWTLFSPHFTTIIWNQSISFLIGNLRQWNVISLRIYVTVRQEKDSIFYFFILRWENTKWRYVKSYRPWRYGIGCMHVYFLFRVNETTPFMSPKVGITFSGHPIYAFHYAGLVIYQFKNNQLEFRTPPGSKTYKRFFRRRESIHTITPDSSFHQNFILT